MDIYIPLSFLWIPWIITIGSFVYFKIKRSGGAYKGGDYGGGAIADLLYWLIIVVVTWSIYHTTHFLLWLFS